MAEIANNPPDQFSPIAIIVGSLNFNHIHEDTPVEGKGYRSVFCLRIPMDCIVCGPQRIDTTQRLSLSHGLPKTHVLDSSQLVKPVTKLWPRGRSGKWVYYF